MFNKRVCTKYFVCKSSSMQGYNRDLRDFINSHPWTHHASCRFREKMETLNNFFRIYKVPPELALRVRSNVEHIWIMQQGLDVNAILEELPENLRIDVLMELQVPIQMDYLRLAVLNSLKQLFLQGKNYWRIVLSSSSVLEVVYPLLHWWAVVGA